MCLTWRIWVCLAIGAAAGSAGAAAPAGGAVDAGMPSALERLAAAVASAVDEKPLEPPVGIFVDDEASPLSRAFGSLLSAELARRHLAPVPVSASNSQEAEKRARAAGLRSLLRLRLSLEGSTIAVAGDGLSTWVNFWSGASPTRSGPALVLTNRQTADEQALALSGREAFQSPAPSMPDGLTLSLETVAHLPRRPAALAVADLGRTHGKAVLLLVENALWALAGDGAVLWQLQLSAPVARQPTRDEFGAIGFGAGRISAWSARLAKPEWVSPEGRHVGFGEAIRVGPLNLRIDTGLNRFSAQTTWDEMPVVLSGAPQSVSWRDSVGLMTFANGSASVVHTAPTEALFHGLGPGSTLCDLDGDQTAELVASSTRRTGERDDIWVFPQSEVEALQTRGGRLSELTPRWRSSIEGRAVVAACGDLDGDGTEEAVFGVWLPSGEGKVLVLRRAKP